MPITSGTKVRPDAAELFPKDWDAFLCETVMTQKQAGEATGVSQPTLSRYLLGKTPPTVTFLYNFAHLIGVPPSRYLDGLEDEDTLLGRMSGQGGTAPRHGFPVLGCLSGAPHKERYVFGDGVAPAHGARAVYVDVPLASFVPVGAYVVVVECDQHDAINRFIFQGLETLMDRGSRNDTNDERTLRVRWGFLTEDGRLKSPDFAGITDQPALKHAACWRLSGWFMKDGYFRQP